MESSSFREVADREGDEDDRNSVSANRFPQTPRS